MVEFKDPESKKKVRTLVFPRYHQLDVVRKLVSHAATSGPGHRYLIQHSAGSGKSNSIAWLAQHLVELHDGKNDALFDSVIVVTDRRNLDDQINRTMKSMANQAWMIGHADKSGDLRDLITAGKRIIITTVQKFPYIVGDIGDTHRDRNFAIIIDEAHSSQGGRAAGQLNAAISAGVSEDTGDEEATDEDAINALMDSRKMPSNASYFAFTATPKNRTLELFGQKTPEGTFEPFHSYTMKQAIQEGFILDVLQNYTPVRSYYHLVKTIEDDPEFDVRKAGKALRNHVESHEATIARKAKIIVDHFQSQVINAGKINGEARGLVATQSIRRAIDYWQAINRELAERGHPWKTIVAFTGEHDVEEIGKAQTESSLNGFPSKDIPDKLREKPYRMLIVADKFLTGYDEPLLHTMYVDKTLSGVKAVQTLSRLNRAAPGKKDTFVLDFANDPDQIVASFQPYYRTTLLSSETDPNKLNDMQSTLDDAAVYRDELVVDFVDRYLADAPRPQLDAMLDVCVENYKDLEEEDQITFKGTAKAFVRTYNFLSQLLPWNNVSWERLAIFLTYLTPRLPSPKEPELDRAILDAIDLDSYRAEVKASVNLGPDDDPGILDPANPTGTGGLTESEFERLSAIVRSFNDIFADANFSDADRVAKQATGPMLDSLVDNEHLQKIASNADQQNQRIEFDIALGNTVSTIWRDNWELFDKLDKDPQFKSAFSEHMFKLWVAKMANPNP
jgi:type I restriction enzyme R subunit